MTAPRIEEDDPFADLIPRDRRKRTRPLEQDPFEDLVPKHNDPTLLDQTKEFVTDVAKGIGHFATHPWEIVTEPAKEVKKALTTPVLGTGEMPGSTRFGDEGAIERSRSNFRVTKENTPGAISQKEHALDVAKAGIDEVLLGSLGSKATYPLVAASGAAHNPEHPVKGAAEAVAGVGLIHGATKLPKVADVSKGMVEAGTKDLARESAAEQSHYKTGMSPRRRPAAPPPVEPPADAAGVSIGETPLRDLGPVGRSTAAWLDVPKEAIGELRRRPAASPPVPQVTPEEVAAALHPQTPPDVAVRIAESANQNALERAQRERRVVPANEFGGPETPTEALREHARAFAYSNLRGKSFVNDEQQIPMRVNRRGIDHTLKHADDTPSGRAHAQSIAALDQLLEDAKYVGSEANRDPRQARGLKALHRFEKPVTIGDQRYNATLTIKEAPDGHFFYDHRLTRYEPVAPSDEPFPRAPRGQESGDAGNATGSGSEKPAPSNVPDHQLQDGGDAADVTGSRLNDTRSGETAHYPSEAEIAPVATANGEFVPRPGVMRKVNAERPALPSPLRLPPEPTAADLAAAQPEGFKRISPEDVAAKQPSVALNPSEVAAAPVSRGRKAPDQFDEARTKTGDLRPFHRVSDDGLLRELNEYQTKIVDAQQRAQYNWTMDENFHSTEDGRAVVSATRIGGKGVSQQAKALQNLQDYDRIVKEIEGELAKRGHTSDTIYERQQHLAELDAALERDAIDRSNNELDADTAFDFGDEPTPGASGDLGDGGGKPPAKRAAGEGDAEPPISDILNVAKLDLADKSAEQRVAQQLEQHRALRDSNKQTFAEADANRAEIVKELVAGDGKALSPNAARKLSGEELLARRDVVRQNDKIITELSKEIESGKLSIAEHEQAQALVQKAVDHNDALLSDLVTGSSQKGRDLNLLRRIANRSLDADVWQLQAKRLLGDRPLTDEISTTIRRLAREAAEACGGEG